MWHWTDSLYPLGNARIENYGGGLVGHRNGGSWGTGVGNDGRLRNGIPFEPLCNCPGYGASWGTVSECGAGETVLLSEMWEGVVNAGMYHLRDKIIALAMQK